MDRGVLFAVAAADEAVADAGIDKLDPERTGVVVGSAIGGIGIVEEQQRVLLEKGPGRVSATFLPNCLVDTATSYIATKLGVVGLNFAVVSACATGSHAIGEAAELIRQGRADVILAGGTEACITPLVLAGFCQMQALAPGNDDAGRLAPVRPGPGRLRDRRGRGRGPAGVRGLGGPAGPRSTPRSPATAPPTTPTTWPPRTRPAAG